MSVDASQLRELSADLQHAAGPGVAQAAHQWVVDLARATQQQAQAKAPRRTGALAASITVTYTSPTRAEVGPAVFYGADVEFGTRAHPITARRAKALVFTVHGTTVYARRVHHPGSRAEPFMAPALARAVAGVPALASRAARLITEGAR